MSKQLANKDYLVSEISRQHWEERKGQNEIASILGISKGSIYNLAKAYHLKMRSYSEGMRNAENFHYYPNLSLSPTMAYILGVIRGDGHCHVGPRTSWIALEVADFCFVDSFICALRSIGLNPRLEWLTKRKPTWQNHWRTVASSNLFGKWYVNLIWDDIFRTFPKDRSLLSMFFKGFYESEGCLETRNYDKGYKLRKPLYRLRLTNTDYDLLVRLRSLMLNCGFHSTIICKNRGKPNWKPCYALSFSRQAEIKALLAEIQPCIPRKRMGG